MKPLKSYKTFEAIYQDMRDEGCSDVQHGFAAKPILEKDALGYDKYVSIGFSWDQNQFVVLLKNLGALIYFPKVIVYRNIGPIF